MRTAPETGTPSNPLTEGPLLAAILRLSWPMMLGNFLQTSSSIFDMVFVGRLGPDAIAGVSMSGAIIQLVMTLVIGIDMGMRAMVSRFYGARDLAMTRRVVGQALLMAAILSLCLGTAGELWRDELLRLIGASPQVVAQGSAYLQIFFLGVAATVSLFFTSGILQSIGDAHTPMRLGAVAFGANILLDPLFIFGWGPFPALGVPGAALATVLSRGVAGLLLLRLLFKNSEIGLRLADLRPDFPLMERMLRIALPGSLQIGCYGVADILANYFIAGFGTAAVAAFGVAARSTMLLMVIGFGLSGAAATLVGQNLGAGKSERAAHSAWIITGLYGGALLGGTFAYFLGARTIIEIFTEDPQTLALGIDCLRVFSLGFLFISLNLILGRALQGAGDTLSPMLFALVSRLPLLMGLLYVLPRLAGLGTDGLWYSFVIASAVEGLLKLFWFQRGKWKTRRV
ncbi:MAG: MATE family efflux transporter [Candidatus Latescibacteria bacterium]|nr:MATE family efflux transporter [Candidatus Latescibacterota bacterium]